MHPAAAIFHSMAFALCSLAHFCAAAGETILQAHPVLGWIRIIWAFDIWLAMIFKGINAFFCEK